MKEDQRQLLARQLKQRRKTFEKLNFCNIMDLQLKLSTSKATSATVQDVHHDIARGIQKSPGKLIVSAVCFKLRPELRYLSNNVKKTKRGLSDCSIFFYLYLLPVSCLELFSKCCQVRQQLGIVNQLAAAIINNSEQYSNARSLLASTFYLPSEEVAI